MIVSRHYEIVCFAYCQVRERCGGGISDIGDLSVDTAGRARIQPITGRVLTWDGVPGKGNIGGNAAAGQ